MILTKSPHYITVPWISPSSATVPDKYILEIRIWEGLKTAVPVNANYEEENINPLGLSGSIDINISPYINDILTTNVARGLNTGVIASNSAVWVKTQVIYYIGGVAQSPEFVSTDLAVRGYGYGIEGKNPTTPANNVLAFSEDVNVSSSSNFILPFKASETEVTNISIQSKPNNTINYSVALPITNNSNDLVSSAFVKVSEASTDEYIEIKRNNVLVSTLTIKEEMRYTPFDCWFVNKSGQLQSITFFKEKETSLKVKSDDYESSIGQASDGVHQLVTFNKRGNTSFKANTGFILEENNEIIKQLYLSEKVWILEGFTFNPVNVSSSSVSYKTRQKDRLLNYEVSFNYAYNEINDI